MNNKFNVWEGVYSSFSEIKNKEEEEAFSSEKWIDNINLSIEMENGILSGINDKHDSITNDYPIIMLIAFMTENKKIKVLDYGGGITSLYLYMTKIIQSNNYELDVFDNEKLCLKARELFENFKNINFIFSANEFSEKYDLIHAGSSLQYIENWRDILSSFERMQPEYIVLSDVPAGDIDTYVTAQNYYGKFIPCWFFNVEDICKSFSKYKLIFKQKYRSKILGKTRKLPMENFPNKNKIDYALNMVFKLK